MAGHLGAERVTTQNLQVVRTDAERGLIMVKGAVPGVEGGWVTVRDAVKRPLPKEAPKPGKFREATAAPATAPRRGSAGARRAAMKLEITTLDGGKAGSSI